MTRCSSAASPTTRRTSKLAVTAALVALMSTSVLVVLVAASVALGSLARPTHG